MKEEQLSISPPTATNYLNELEKMGILSSKKIDKEMLGFLICLRNCEEIKPLKKNQRKDIIVI